MAGRASSLLPPDPSLWEAFTATPMSPRRISRFSADKKTAQLPLRPAPLRRVPLNVACRRWACSQPDLLRQSGGASRLRNVCRKANRAGHKLGGCDREKPELLPVEFNILVSYLFFN